jgi:hypothetical protein
VVTVALAAAAGAVAAPARRASGGGYGGDAVGDSGGGGGAGFGGAVFVRSPARLDLIRCTFTSNESSQGLGGTGTDPGISGQGLAAAIFAMPGSDVNALGVSFMGNIASHATGFGFESGELSNTNDVWGTLIDVDIAIATDPIAFGPSPINTSFNPTMSLVIFNPSALSLEFDTGGLSIIGPDADQFTFDSNPSLAPLAPGASRVVPITFDPNSLGAKSAQVRVDIDGLSPRLVQLTGEGSAPVAASSGLQTQEIVDDLLDRIDLDVDVNADTVEDAADVVTNENEIDMN